MAAILEVDQLEGSTGTTVSIPAGQTLSVAGTLTVTGATSFAGVTISDLGTVTTADINGGTVDGVTIGGTTPAAGTFTTFTSTGIDDNTTSTALTLNSNQTADFASNVSSVGGFLAPDGVVNAPGFRFTDDSDTGFWQPATNQIALSTGGAEALRVDNNGNMGLGVTPGSWSTGTAVQIGVAGSIWYSGSFINMLENAYFDTTWKYQTTDATSRIAIGSGGVEFLVAPSGTADTPITWTTATIINNDGSQEWGTWSATGVSTGKLLGDTADKLLRSSVDTAVARNHQIFYNPNGAIAAIGTNGTSLEILALTGPTVTTKFNNDGSQEWGTFSATGTSAGAKISSETNHQRLSLSALDSASRNLQIFANTNGTVGSITISGTATAYNTSSDPRLKSTFTAVSEAEAFALVDAYTAPEVLGKFHFLADDTKEVLGFNAHAVLDLPFGDSIATEGQGPRNAVLGEEYDTGEVDENGDPIMGTVTPAGVDQSKPVPGMLIAMGHLVNKARKFDALSDLLVTKGVLTQAEVDAL